MKKNFLGIEIDTEPHKIARELVGYMLEINNPLSIEELTHKLSETNSINNLRTRIKRCLTNTPNVVNERTSEQSRKFSIPLHYQNIEVIQEGDKFSLKLSRGNFPEVRETDYTSKDLQEFMENKTGVKRNTVINIKSEFAKWLLENAPDSYSQYLGTSIQSTNERLDEINGFFTENDIFELDKNNPSELMNYINFKNSKSERVKNSAFFEYDKLNSNGVPKAVIGKNNYIKFIIDNYILSQEIDIKPLVERALFLNNLKSSNQNLYDWINNFLSFDSLQSVINKYEPQDFRPVNMLRFLIGKEIEKGTSIDSELIELLKEVIESRDISDYYEFNDRVNLKLQNYKDSDRGMFPNWKSQFSVLAPFLYTDDDKKTDITAMSKIADGILNKYELSEPQKHIVSFAGAQNYGDDRAWGAVIPKEAPNVQSAYQLFFAITPKGIESGLYKGHKVDDDEVINTSELFTTYGEFINSVSAYILKWKELNNALNFNLNKEERDFRSRIKSSDSKSLQTYFQVLDKLIEDLEIDDSENLVFSTGSNQLSFQVGKRYCLNLKKDNFDFIAPENHKIDNVESGMFSEPDVASFYKNVSNDIVLDNYDAILESVQFELERDNHTNEKDYDNSVFRRAVFDKEYREQFFEFDQAIIPNKKIIEMNSSINHNQIFFGPPGTGKTYHTINESIKIADPDFYAENKNNRDKLKERFQLLLLNSNDGGDGQIGFSTFHQSFSYEDFVEGIKPVEPKEGDEYLKYKIQEGVFKKICRLASDSLKAVVVNSDSLISLTEEDFDKSHFYKMSLGNSQEDDDQDIFDYCIENNCISIGFGEGLDFTGKDEKELKIFGREKGLKTFPIQAINLFKNYLKGNNYVVISKGNNYVRAIGKVVGEYEYLEESPFPNNPTFNHFRKVEWIFNDKEISAKEIYNKNLSQQTIYKLVKNEIKEDFFVKEKKVDNLKLPKNPKDFVLIIDEINRGNVSSIFGELITLIEKDKRAGGNEELSVILPYSKKEFKVPQNVYIIGTMNTADRSIEALDTALRRRFSFREMPPKHQLIATVGKLKESKGKIGDIDVVRILEVINNRIEKLIDKDHKIGHSYFLNIRTKGELKGAFKDKVIPLLEEYFFGDFGKISLILGSSFITKETKSDVKFAKTNEYDTSVENDLLERSVYEVTDQDDWNFKAIYE